MARATSDYERWREAEAARLVASGRIDTDAVRELLVLACHSSPVAQQFFEGRQDDCKVRIGRLFLDSGGT